MRSPTCASSCPMAAGWCWRGRLPWMRHGACPWTVRVHPPRRCRILKATRPGNIHLPPFRRHPSVRRRGAQHGLLGIGWTCLHPVRRLRPRLPNESSRGCRRPICWTWDRPRMQRSPRRRRVGPHPPPLGPLLRPYGPRLTRRRLAASCAEVAHGRMPSPQRWRPSFDLGAPRRPRRARTPSSLRWMERLRPSILHPRRKTSTSMLPPQTAPRRRRWSASLRRPRSSRHRLMWQGGPRRPCRSPRRRPSKASLPRGSRSRLCGRASWMRLTRTRKALRLGAAASGCGRWLRSPC